MILIIKATCFYFITFYFRNTYLIFIMKPLSAVIITYNEEENIGRCIDSLWQVADEVIVLDSFSTDNTVTIARHKGAIVKQNSFSGYKEQKNKALQFATYDYVLSLDADEALSPELICSILEAKKEFKYKAYFMNRYNNYCGRFINHGLWYPDQKVRLFDKQVAKWGGMNPHDKIELREIVYTQVSSRRYFPLCL